MTSAEIQARSIVIINEIIQRCKESEWADQIVVFGSVARGSKTPGDLDIALDLTSMTFDDFVQNGVRSQVQFLLTLGHRKTFKFEGHFDPFVLLSDRTLVRDSSSTCWVDAKSAASLRDSIKKEGLPLSGLQPL